MTLTDKHIGSRSHSTLGSRRFQTCLTGLMPVPQRHNTYTKVLLWTHRCVWPANHVSPWTQVVRFAQPRRWSEIEFNFCCWLVLLRTKLRGQRSSGNLSWLVMGANFQTADLWAILQCACFSRIHVSLREKNILNAQFTGNPRGRGGLGGEGLYMHPTTHIVFLWKTVRI